MRARKAVGRASELLTGVAADPRPVLPKLLTGDTPRNDAYYDAQIKAARPAILLYLNGKGPRPKDFWLWHDASKDRKTLRQLHAKGLARDDPRYWDALIEAARAGDPLSRKEGRDLAEHVRVMDDCAYPVLENRASELSAQARALGRTVAAVKSGGRHGGKQTGVVRKKKSEQWQQAIDKHYQDNPQQRPTTYRGAAAYLHKTLKLDVDKETIRKYLSKSHLIPPRFLRRTP